MGYCRTGTISVIAYLLRALMKTFYKGSSAALLVYDIANQKSFTDLDYWYKQISNLLIMQNSTVKVRLLLCWLEISLIQKKIGKSLNMMDWLLLKKIELHFIKSQLKLVLMQNLYLLKLQKVYHFITLELTKIMEESEKIKN